MGNIREYIKFLPAAFSIGIASLGLVLYELGNRSVEDILPIILWSILPLAFNEIFQKLLLKDIHADLIITKNKVEVLTTDLLKNGLIPMETERLKDPNEYQKLWGGFDSGTYYAFNPSYKIETDHYTHSRNKIVDIFVERYKQIQEAQYIFLIKDDYDENGKKKDKSGLEDLIEFKIIMEEVAKQDSRVKKHSLIKVKIVKNKNRNDYGEFYLGHRGNERFCILEPTGNAIGESRGHPNYYLLTSNPDITTSFKNNFDNFWYSKHGYDSEDLNIWDWKP